MSLLDAFQFVQAAPRAGAEASWPARSPPEHANAKGVADPTLTKLWQASKVPLPTLQAGKEYQTSSMPQLNKQQQAALKALVRKGVPFNLRPAVWLVASGGLAKAQAAPAGQFDKLAGSAASLPTLVVSQVDADVRTVCLTWRQNTLLKTPAAIQAMSRILVALLTHNRNLGYNRQLCHMVAFTLVVFGGPGAQEQVFWTLAALLQDKLYGYCNGQWAMGSRVEQEVLTRLVARKLPRLTSQLANMRLSLPTFTQSWLSGLYVSCLPPEVLARVWDCMMVEGNKLLLRVALALLKMYEQTLSACTFPEVLRKVLELRVSRTTDAAGLLAAALKGCGSLPGQQVETLRAEALKAATDGARGSDSQPTAIPGNGRNSPSAANSMAGSEPINGNPSMLAGSSAASGGGVLSSFLQRSASGPKLLQRHSPTSGTSPTSHNSPLSSPVRSSDGIQRAAHDAEIMASSSRESSPDRSCDGSVELNKNGDGGNAGFSKRASVGAQLSSMMARLRGSAGMPRSATTSSVPALAAC